MSILWRPMTPAERRDCRQRDEITMLLALVIALTLIIGWQAWLRSEDTLMIQAQDELINYQSEQISDHQDIVTALEDQIAILQLELALSKGNNKAVVSAYTHTGDPTASGVWPEVGRTVAGPTWVPFGTVVEIDGVGERIVEDRTHSRFNGRYDVFMETAAECDEWGIPVMEVTVR